MSLAAFRSSLTEKSSSPCSTAHAPERRSGRLIGLQAMTTAPETDWRLAIVLLALVIVAVSTSRLAGLGVERDHATAAVRAVVQLAGVALVIAAVMESLWWSFAFAVVRSATA